MDEGRHSGEIQHRASSRRRHQACAARQPGPAQWPDPGGNAGGKDVLERGVEGTAVPGRPGQGTHVRGTSPLFCYSYIPASWPRPSLALVAALVLVFGVLAPPCCAVDVVLRQAWTFKYCRFHANTSSDGSPNNYFTSHSYTYFGQQPLFRLPTPMDSIQPNAAEYALNGSCEYLLDSGCNVVVPGLPCEGCCYVSPSAVPFQTTCFNNFDANCNYVYSAYSGQCGSPPAKYLETMYCNVCSF